MHKEFVSMIMDEEECLDNFKQIIMSLKFGTKKTTYGLLGKESWVVPFSVNSGGTEITGFHGYSSNDPFGYLYAIGVYTRYPAIGFLDDLPMPIVKKFSLSENASYSSQRYRARAIRKGWDFSRRRRSILSIAGGIPLMGSYANGKDGGKFSGRIVDSDMHDIRRFMNRILGLPLDIQNSLQRTYLMKERRMDSVAQVFADCGLGIIPAPEKIGRLQSVLGNMKPADVGLNPKMHYFRSSNFRGPPPITYLHLFGCPDDSAI